jgi:AcrR family transcriptional regulator
VFLRDGFHGASLAQIAEEAGYTFGAVSSSFQNKDDLFLAVMDAESQRRVSRPAPRGTAGSTAFGAFIRQT